MAEALHLKDLCSKDVGVSIHFKRIFHDKPSILGVFPLFLETPMVVTPKQQQWEAIVLFEVRRGQQVG